MFAKRLIQKAVHHHLQHNLQHGNLTSTDLDLQVAIHYGIPTTASLLAFDPIQRLLAIGTLDGRIKVIGGDNIEGLLVSPRQLPYKHIEFLQNQGYLVSISNDNDIQVWNLESRCLACCLQWESNITAFSVINGSHFMYIGDEYGLMSVIKYNAEERELSKLPYCISADSLSEAVGFPFLEHQPIVGLLPQPGSSGNRVLIAYESGLMVLWDISEARILFVGGGKDLQLKDGAVDAQNEGDANLADDYLQEKEISALCWASSNGSIVAVGYVDGDILFWNTSPDHLTRGQQTGLSSRNVVKLQLSSAERKLPIIVLHWSIDSKSHNVCDGRLFIYGGDEIGSEEVLTVLALEWSSGKNTLRCAGRLDITLAGSFADMILLPTAGRPSSGNHKDALFVLTNPGQLHLYDDASLSVSLLQQERKASVSAVEFPAVVPTADPSITVTKITNLPMGAKLSKILLEMASTMKLGSTATLPGHTKWPLTGGLPSQLSIAKSSGVQRVYIAGYQDGSVRIWDATYPILSPVCFLEEEVQGIKVAGLCSPVSNLDLCFITLTLAVGNELGLVRIYSFNGHSDETPFCIVTETKREVHTLPQVKGPSCKAIFHLINSRILALQFAHSGAKLAVGFECGRVAVLDMSSLSVLFFTDSVSGSASPVISMTWEEYTNTHGLVKGTKHSETKPVADLVEEALFVLTKHASINVIDGGSGSMINSHPWLLKKESIAISMYVIEGSISESGLTNEKQPESSQVVAANNELMQDTATAEINSHESEHNNSLDAAHAGERLLDMLVLLCCEDALRLYPTKHVIQGNNKTIHKVKHAKPCCWSSVFRKDEKVCGLVLLFQTGELEIRSLPDLELMKETSLVSILRWNFKSNMEKTMSSLDDGLITLVNGCELAFISLVAGENCFRIPESLPCLHDKVLAAAADAAFSVSLNQKKKQGTAPGVLGGIVKGFKGGRTVPTVDIPETPKSNFTHLDEIFQKSPFSDSPPTLTDIQEVVELNIDDIEIDEPLPVSTSSSHEDKNLKREKGTDREKLLGTTDDTKPRLRTPEEIKAKYRKAGDASSAASHARNKLVERQEKLERISRRTEELQSGAEDFASMANELVKVMENRKWWQI